MYGRVPQRLSSSRSLPWCRNTVAIPKSDSFRISCSSRSRFSGLMSLKILPFVLPHMIYFIPIFDRMGDSCTCGWLLSCEGIQGRKWAGWKIAVPTPLAFPHLARSYLIQSINLASHKCTKRKTKIKQNLLNHNKIPVKQFTTTAVFQKDKLPPALQSTKKE